MDAIRSSITLAAERLREASTVWQIGFGALFLAVGSALVVLLRRAPRGIDV
jgi:hypothetical protein